MTRSGGGGLCGFISESQNSACDTCVWDVGVEGVRVRVRVYV